MLPVLRAMAPKQTEPPFVLAQGVVLVLFVVLGALAAIRFRGDPVRMTRAGTGGAREIER